LEKDGEEEGGKRIDEEEMMEGGLRGRFSAGGEVYFSAKQRSFGGTSFFSASITCRIKGQADDQYQPVCDSLPSPLPHLCQTPPRRHRPQQP